MCDAFFMHTQRGNNLCLSGSPAATFCFDFLDRYPETWYMCYVELKVFEFDNFRSFETYKLYYGKHSLN